MVWAFTQFVPQSLPFLPSSVPSAIPSPSTETIIFIYFSSKLSRVWLTTLASSHFVSSALCSNFYFLVHLLNILYLFIFLILMLAITTFLILSSSPYFSSLSLLTVFFFSFSTCSSCSASLSPIIFLCLVLLPHTSWNVHLQIH